MTWDLLAWIGAAGLSLALADCTAYLVYRFGPSWRRSWRGFWSRCRLRLLERRVNALAKRHGYRRAPSLGQLRFTRSRRMEWNGPPEGPHGGDE